MGDVAGTTEPKLQPEFERSPQNLPGSVTPPWNRGKAHRTEMSLYQALRQAVRKNAFHLAYQPILDLRTDRIVGAEALLRWHTGTEVICAGEFIETLEKSDLLDTVAEFTMREACSKAAWIQQQLRSDFRVAVNVAPQQWTRPWLAETVNAALQESGCNPSMLDLEITERTGLCDCPQVQSAIRHFRDQGIVVTLDDFGAGFANFTFLRRFPINHLKIDKYYCRHSKAHSRVLEPVIAAAHRAGITCTAEGIETEAQLRQLQRSDCDEAQGYHIARPMDFESLVTLLQTQTLFSHRLPLANFWRHEHAS
jgi:EAL domain-containing protein (putative c-di-GMP-specific phosphodiesterase class I)